MRSSSTVTGRRLPEARRCGEGARPAGQIATSAPKATILTTSPPGARRCPDNHPSGGGDSGDHDGSPPAPPPGSPGSAASNEPWAKSISATATRFGPHQWINRRGEGEHRGIADQQQEEPGIDCTAKARGQAHGDTDHTRPGEQRRSRWLNGDDWERQHDAEHHGGDRGSTGGWWSPSCRSPQSASAIGLDDHGPEARRGRPRSPHAPRAAAAERRSIDQMRRATCSIGCGPPEDAAQGRTPPGHRNRVREDRKPA